MFSLFWRRVIKMCPILGKWHQSTRPAKFLVCRMISISSKVHHFVEGNNFILINAFLAQISG